MPSDDGMLERAQEVQSRLISLAACLHHGFSGPEIAQLIADFGRAIRREALEECREAALFQGQVSLANKIYDLIHPEDNNA